MITVCAWCQRLVEADPEDRLVISHGICQPCQAVSRARDLPTLVVSRRHASLVPALEHLLRGAAIPVVLDRRLAARRESAGPAPAEERRRGGDRRLAGDAALS